MRYVPTDFSKALRIQIKWFTTPIGSTDDGECGQFWVKMWPRPKISKDVADRPTFTATGTTDGDRKSLYLCFESLWEARRDVADLVWALTHLVWDVADKFSRLWIFTFHAHFRDFLLRSVGEDDINCGTIATSKALRFAQKWQICTFDPSLDAAGLKVSSARRISSVRHFWEHLVAFIRKLRKNNHLWVVRSQCCKNVHLWPD